MYVLVLFDVELLSDIGRRVKDKFDANGFSQVPSPLPHQKKKKKKKTLFIIILSHSMHDLWENIHVFICSAEYEKVLNRRQCCLSN